MNVIEKRIQEASQRYYTDGTSTLTDDQFDELVDELVDVAPDSPVLSVGWGYDIDKDTTPGAKINHKYQEAGSLDKCRKWREFGRFLQNTPIDVSLKLDGISVVCYYENNELQYALTRGNGIMGIDITDKVLQICPSCKKLSSDNISFTGSVRGEIIMSYSDFQSYSDIHVEAKNPRNSVAGIINGKNTQSDLQFLSIIFYSITGIEDMEVTSIESMRNLLQDMFDSSNLVPYSSVTLTEDNYEDTLNMLKTKFYGVVPADGLVLTASAEVNTVNNAVITIAKAFKFPSEVKSATVEWVEWNMSKSNYAIPKVKLKPIELAGTTVQYCTGYNAKYILDNGIGPGAIVAVEKRGEIIPNINEVVKSSESDMIENCKNCGEPLIWKGVNLVCNNKSCSNSKLKDALIWIDNICPRDNLGDKLKLKFLSDLAEMQIISDISVESIMECDVKLPVNTSSIQQNEFNQLWNDLHALKNIEAKAALLALNVPRLGDKTAEKLAKFPKYIEYLSGDEVDTNIYSDMLLQIGQVNTDTFLANRDKFKRLSYLNICYSDDITNISEKQQIAVTGKLSMKRKDFETLISQFGYAISEISSKTKYLVTNDPDSNSSKNAKADKLGIPKLTEADFMLLLK